MDINNISPENLQVILGAVEATSPVVTSAAVSHLDCIICSGRSANAENEESYIPRKYHIKLLNRLHTQSVKQLCLAYNQNGPFQGHPVISKRFTMNSLNYAAKNAILLIIFKITVR